MHNASYIHDLENMCELIQNGMSTDEEAVYLTLSISHIAISFSPMNNKSTSEKEVEEKIKNIDQAMALISKAYNVLDNYPELQLQLGKLNSLFKVLLIQQLSCGIKINGLARMGKHSRHAANLPLGGHIQDNTVKLENTTESICYIIGDLRPKE
ncbi:hypothetical protein ACQKFL_24045 [Vreelandella titanicae]|uniref:hypothetical protein n=1 Tax=Vreelandella titanicae TaxID=664683 RepID=UPI003D007CA5|tara:strand:- start:2915 stop:3376 length:462 start_codon:yes stop_codon:yes gene_type:complete